MDQIVMTPIGHVRGGRSEAVKDHWGNNICHLDIDAQRFSPDALLGLNEVSHIEVIFHFHIDADEATETGARHPRNRMDWPLTGIFAQHGRMRPNRMGVSICRILKLDGITLTVQGLDAVDGTPVLDIKPVWNSYLPQQKVTEPAWVKELMENYW